MRSTALGRTRPDVVALRPSPAHDPALLESALLDESALPESALLPAPAHPRGAPAGGSRLLGASLCILAALLLGFVAEVVVLGGMRHARDQRVAFADLRQDLASATAPVGQVDGDGRLNATGRPLAILEVPTIGLREVILEGTTGRVLQSGPGHRRDTVLPGQPGTSVVMGRQAAYGGPFGELDKIRSGATITVTTGQGRHTYRVAGVRRTGDPEPPPLVAGQGRLTLVTATGPAFMPTDVLRVDAELVSEVAPAAVRLLGPTALSPTELAMSRDTSAWISVLLLAQALLLAAVVLAWSLVRWGGWQTWVVAVPLLALIGLALAGEAAQLLPNLL